MDIGKNCLNNTITKNLLREKTCENCYHYYAKNKNFKCGSLSKPGYTCEKWEDIVDSYSQVAASDETVIAVASSSSPYVTTYKRDGKDWVRCLK
jgi:hypothetical protein